VVRYYAFRRPLSKFHDQLLKYRDKVTQGDVQTETPESSPDVGVFQT
jgi:hypothetical protein